MNKTCTLCGQEIRQKGSRVCGRCNLPVLRNHKYQFNGSVIGHRVCAEPTNYVLGGEPVERPAEQQTLEVTA